MKTVTLKYHIQISNGQVSQDIWTAASKNNIPKVIKAVIPTYTDMDIKQRLVFIQDLKTKEYFVYE